MGMNWRDVDEEDAPQERRAKACKRCRKIILRRDDLVIIKNEVYCLNCSQAIRNAY